jgi:hypothetical protein
VYDNLIAAALGGFSSALRFQKYGWLQFMQIFISSTCLAFFAGQDLADFISSNSGIVISYGAVYFALAYFGSTLLDRSTIFIKSVRVSKKWRL